MRQPHDRSSSPALTASAEPSVGSLVRRLAIISVLLAGLTILASIALAHQG